MARARLRPGTAVVFVAGERVGTLGTAIEAWGYGNLQTVWLIRTEDGDLVKVPRCDVEVGNGPPPVPLGY